MKQERPMTPIKPQIFFIIVLLYKAYYTSKKYLRFYRCHGPYQFDKTSDFLYLIKMVAPRHKLKFHCLSPFPSTFPFPSPTLPSSVPLPHTVTSTLFIHLFIAPQAAIHVHTKSQ